MKIPYNGTYITCGAYAVLNALMAEHIDLLLLEMSAGAPFGVCSMSDAYGCTRLLTVYRDFNDGFDAAAGIWGIKSTCYRNMNGEELCGLFQNPELSCVIGPVNMQALSYLPTPSLYRAADHYLAVRPYGRSRVLISDSEGMPGKLLDMEAFMKLLCPKGIPESRNDLIVRSLELISDGIPRKQQLEYIWHIMQRNLWDAEKEGKGSQAFLESLYVMKETEKERWAVPSGYDIRYLMERKLMLQYLLENFRKNDISLNLGRVPEWIEEQLCSAGFAYRAIRSADLREIERQYRKLSEYEKCLAERIKEIKW